MCSSELRFKIFKWNLWTRKLWGVYISIQHILIHIFKQLHIIFLRNALYQIKYISVSVTYQQIKRIIKTKPEHLSIRKYCSRLYNLYKYLGVIIIKTVFLLDRTLCGKQSWSRHMMTMLDGVDLLLSYDNA